MKNLCLLFVLFAVVAAGTTAQEKKSGAEAKPVALKGYIVDQMCAKGMLKKDNPMQKAASHTKECALEESCAASGYGLFSDGKWYVFDDAGAKQAKGMIEKDKREKGLSYEVTGVLDGGTLTVASIKETKLDAKVEKKKD